MADNNKVQSLANAISNCIDRKLGNIDAYMPIAGASTLGGVKIGDGFTMVGDTLTLDIAPDSVVSGLIDDIFNAGASGAI